MAKFFRRRAPRRKPAARRPRRAGRRAPKAVVTNISRALTPFPQRYITKMKYSEVVTTDVNGQYVMNLNSIYDPNRTGSGHQPYGFDTLASLYNRYRVIACGWRLQSLITTVGNPRILLAMPSNDLSITYTSISEMREQPRTRYVNINPGATPPTLQGKCYIPSLIGRTRAQYMADDQYQAVVTSNPSELALLYIQTADQIDGLAGAVAVQVVLEYTVEFFDPKHVVQS